MSFAIAKDMDFFNVDVMSILHFYNDKEHLACSSKFDGANVSFRRKICDILEAK